LNKFIVLTNVSEAGSNPFFNIVAGPGARRTLVCYTILERALLGTGFTNFK
jgi:hypothetical protein